MWCRHGWPAPVPIPLPCSSPIFAAVQHEAVVPKGAGNVLGGPNLQHRRPTMSYATHPITPTLSTPAERKPSPLVRVIRAIVEARTRMYLQAVTDPVTGRIDPELERQ